MNDNQLKYILLEIRSYLLKLGHKCLFPAYNTKSLIWEMKVGKIIIVATETAAKITLESRYNDAQWGMVITNKPYSFARHNLECVAVQLVIGMNDKEYGPSK